MSNLLTTMKRYTGLRGYDLGKLLAAPCRRCGSRLEKRPDHTGKFASCGSCNATLALPAKGKTDA